MFMICDVMTNQRYSVPYSNRYELMIIKQIINCIKSTNKFRSELPYDELVNVYYRFKHAESVLDSLNPHIGLIILSYSLSNKSKQDR